MDEFIREREECLNTDWKPKQKENAITEVAASVTTALNTAANQARATVVQGVGGPTDLREIYDEKPLLDFEEPDFFEQIAEINKKNDEDKTS